MVHTVAPAPPRGALPPLELPPLLLAAIGTALWTVAVGLVSVVALTFAVWVAEPGAATGIGSALRAGALAWLLAHGVGVRVTGGSLSVVPLGLTIALLALLVRSGRGLARDTGVQAPRDALTATAALAASYALAAGALAVLGSGGAASPAAGILQPGLLAFLAAGAGVAWGSGFAAGGWRRLGEQRRAVLRGAAGSLLALLGAGAALVAVATAWHAPAVLRSWSALATGWAGVGLVLLHLALAPLAVTWASAYAVGPGFAVGAGTSVSPFALHVGALPALPLLRALPGAGGVHAAVLIGPLAAGLFGGVLVARHAGWARPRDAAAAAAIAAAIAALIFTLLLWWSGGSAGPGRLASVGPVVLLGGAAAAVELAIPAAAAAWWTARRGRSAAAVEAGVEPIT